MPLSPCGDGVASRCDNGRMLPSQPHAEPPSAIVIAADFSVSCRAIEPVRIFSPMPALALHGGAPVDAETPTRRTLVLRFFGDDGVFRPLGVEDRYKFLGDALFEAAFGGLAAGAQLRSPCFKQIR